MSLLLVLAAAVCSGAAVVLQAVAVRRQPPADGAASVGLLLRLARQPIYLVALALIAAGFGCAALALQSLPVFLVQAGRASSLAVTALLAVVALRVRLRLQEAVAVVVVVLGLVALAGSASSDRSAGAPAAVWAVPLAVAVLGVAVVVIGARSRGHGLLLALAAGAGFGLLAFAVHELPSLAPAVLVRSPLGYAALVAGGIGLQAGALALQRFSVMAVTATMVAGETLLGSALGLAFGGDAAAPGRGLIAIGGFSAVLAGALLLSRFGGSLE